MKCSSGNYRVAVPIVAKTFSGALKEIAEANRKADLIELRLDLLKEPLSDSALEELVKACKKPCIATNRPKEGEEELDQIERIFLLKKAIGFGAALADIELGTSEGLLSELVHGKGLAAIILSYHNFSETPADEELQKILLQMLTVKGIDIIKIACLAKSEADSKRVLSLIPIARERKKPIIAFCMGKLGEQSRIDCLKRGAFLTFASLRKGKESAEGQLPIGELRKRLKSLERE